MVKKVILILAFAITSLSCKKEIDTLANYKYFYTYQSNCSGVLWVTVPNTFSPNFDNLNDVWFPVIKRSAYDTICFNTLPPIKRNWPYRELHVQVKDIDNNLWYEYKYPEMISDSTWNGRQLNKGGYAPNGKYLWQYILIDPDGIKHQENGLVHILN